MNTVYINCSHYKRKCKFVSPCCRRVYTCRFCHDEKEFHTLDRHQVKEIICDLCGQLQPPAIFCKNCNVKFGNYTCLTCNLFDDESKGQWHCDGCGICRTGGRENYYHCDRCNTCLSVVLKGNHGCIENMSRNNCPICMDDLHGSRDPCNVPKCGHLLHKSCFNQLNQAGHHTCPLCLKPFEFY